VARGAHEPGVLIMRDRVPSEKKFADEHAMDRTLILLSIVGAHQKIARRNPRQAWRQIGIHQRARRHFPDRGHQNRSIVRTIIANMEIADVKRRVVETIERARHRASDRRIRRDAAAKSYEAFLTGTAVPIVRQVANVLRSEGFPFEVFTPAGGVRLASERGADDYIELELDTTEEQPSVIGRVKRSRGRDVMESEQRIGDPLTLGEQEILRFILQELESFVDR
jgi:hypothetical protein